MNETKAKIMVVDDDPGMLFTVTEILEDAGYEVYGAKDGYQAVDLASRETFALVFMDIRLPGIDGIEAYRQIKSVSPGTPVPRHVHTPRIAETIRPLTSPLRLSVVLLI